MNGGQWFDPSALAPLFGYEQANEERENMRRQQQLAEMLMQPQRREYVGPADAALGGLANIIRGITGSVKQYDAQKGAERLSGTIGERRKALLDVLARMQNFQPGWRKDYAETAEPAEPEGYYVRR